MMLVLDMLSKTRLRGHVVRVTFPSACQQKETVRMKRSDIVRIGIAWDYSENPPALPAVLEQYGCRVFVEHIGNMDALSAFFGSPAVDAQFTVMFTHGWGKTDEEAVINWPLFDEANSSKVDHHMTPKNMGGIAKKGSGTLISAACWSGKEAFATGFLDAGFERYIAPASTSDCDSMLQFLTTFFGYLLYEVRDYRPRKTEIAEAVEMSRRIDDLPDGASGWRYFDRATLGIEY
jgi:hypothetical protein